MSSIYIFRGDEVLLIKKLKSRFLTITDGLWCGVGGHFEPDELNHPERCLLRELYEETGLRENDIGGLSLKYITLRKKDDEIRQQYIFFADLSNHEASLRECDEGELHWVKTDRLPSLRMSFTNTQCLEHYFRCGSKNGLVYAAVAENGGCGPRMAFTALGDFETVY